MGVTEFLEKNEMYIVHKIKGDEGDEREKINVILTILDAGNQKLNIPIEENVEKRIKHYVRKGYDFLYVFSTKIEDTSLKGITMYKHLPESNAILIGELMINEEYFEDAFYSDPKKRLELKEKREYLLDLMLKYVIRDGYSNGADKVVALMHEPLGKVGKFLKTCCLNNRVYFAKTFFMPPFEIPTTYLSVIPITFRSFYMKPSYLEDLYDEILDNLPYDVNDKDSQRVLKFQKEIFHVLDENDEEIRLTRRRFFEDQVIRFIRDRYYESKDLDYEELSRFVRENWKRLYPNVHKLNLCLTAGVC